MDNSNLDNNRTSRHRVHVDHTLFDFVVVSDSDEAGINSDNLQFNVGIDPKSLRMLYVDPILFREPPYGSDRPDTTVDRSPLT